MIHSTRLPLLATVIFTVVCPTLSAQAQRLPWEREIPLKEAAQSVYIENTLNPTDPLPDWNCYPAGKAMTINNLKMRTTLWGPPERVTISLTKNNVWDRRVNTRGLEAPTLQEIVDGAYSPANKDFEGKIRDCQRPWGYGYLLKEGGFYDPYRQPIEYPMPCLKPVGQIIVGMDPLAGAAPPNVTQSCANGLVQLQETQGDARASLQYVLGMTSNLYAIRGEFSGIHTPIWLRLYRHRDTAHLKYMSDDGKTYTRKGTEADKAFNFPMDPPTSGTDGRYFWIRQQMPPEKTFPQGFEYVLMGVVITPGKVEIEAVENQTKLGTLPPDKQIANAPGAAATVTLSPDISKLDALVTIVTTMDGPDVLALAKQRLDEAEVAGFDGVLRENTQWWNAFYDKRENGRVFRGLTDTKCSEDIKSIYRSYADGHGGGTHTDMRQYECSAMYVHPERDSQLWSSAPCYNEVFTSNRFVRNWPDNQQMWKQLVWHWMPGGKDNAKNLFGMPGMAILHGYQPPVKPDKIVHTTLTLEFCLETMAQIIKPVWDEWDYGGDVEFLRKECYPLMREMALFYAAYAKKGDDGHYHIIPSMEPEKWGWYAELARNKDVISSLCMFRWALNRASEASEILGVDADLRGTWRKVAENMAPYPTWEGPDGPMYCAIAGVEPKQLPGDHFGEAAEYPTILADEINLDSPKEQKEMMLRTAKKLSNAGTTGQTLILLGVPAESMRDSFDAETLLNSRSGRMHLFPAIAPETEIAFHNFQARGGFLVSAAKNSEEVYFLEVRARRDNTCRIMNPWPGQPIVVYEAGKSEPVAVRMDKSNGECLEFSAVAGKRYSIKARRAMRKTAFGDPDKIDVLVVTGGLGIDRDQFFDLFEDCNDIKCVEYSLKDESEVFEDISDWKYDVLLLYNATQDISQKRRDNFVSLLKDKGIGLVVVHHAQAAFQSWHEFHKIIGTAFIYYDVKIDGKPWPHSKCKGGMDIPVTICDKEHPITLGLTDFRVLDETYKGRWWADDNHVLLTTDHPGNDKPIAWTRSYGRSRVFNIQLGHDYKAYEVPQYCDLIVRGVRWTAGTQGKNGGDSVGESTETVEDADGNVYRTVRIGNQVWTVENLRTTKYNDGTPIPHVTETAEWKGLASPGFCYFNNDPENGKKYGALYNWWAACSDKIAPKGWRVPTHEDQAELCEYLIANGYNCDGTKDGNKTGNKLAKSMTAKTDWEHHPTPETAGNDLTTNNSTGFSALPAGSRWNDGSFHSIGQSVYWWSTTPYGTSEDAHMSSIHSRFAKYGFNQHHKRSGFCIRLVREASEQIPTDGLKLWFRADRGVTHSDNKVLEWEDQSGSNLHAKKNRGQPMLLASAIGGKPAIHFNGKGDVLEFKGWSPNGLTAMTTIIVSANTEFQPEPYKGGWDEGGHCGTLQSVLNWPEQPGVGPHAWGNVILSAFQKSVSYRFGTGQLSNSNNWKRPACIGDSPTMTTAIHDGATEKLYVEGELVWTQTDKLTTIKNCASNGFIGRWSHGGDNSGWFAGNVAEIIVYTRALDDTDRKKVEDYLRAKYFAVATASAAAQKGIELHQTSNAIDVNIDGKPFTSYIYQIDPVKPLAAEGVLLTKPVLYPLRTPSGIKVTRGWPFEKMEGESQDHAHHAGLYFTYDIPGNSFWNNSTQPLPVIRQIKAQITNDPQGNPAIQSVMHWIDKNNDTLLVEKRLTSFIAGPNQNIIDFDIELKAVTDTVEFGVTKEGMFAIRLAQWLTESGGTGAYLSSNGDEKEQGVWGKRAEWVRIEGKHNGATVGIAILNHPASTNYPTYWHARGYGCFSANPLGQYAFEKSRKVENPQPFNLTLKKGEAAPFKFRVILYDGSRTKQQLDNEFQEYVR